MDKKKAKAFKANPSIDRDSFNKENIIFLKDSDKQKISKNLTKQPVTQNVLKWRLTSDEIPFSMTCWVGEEGGWSTLAIECELVDDKFTACTTLKVRAPLNGKAELGEKTNTA